MVYFNSLISNRLEFKLFENLTSFFSKNKITFYFRRDVSLDEIVHILPVRLPCDIITAINKT